MWKIVMNFIMIIKKNETHKIHFDLEIQMGLVIPSRKENLGLINNQKKNLSSSRPQIENESK